MRPSLSTPSDTRLAAQGWRQVSSSPYLSGSGIQTTKFLICTTAPCGGGGFIAVGDKAMPASEAQGFRAVMANPSLTDRKLLAALQLLWNGSPILANIGGHVTGAHKTQNSLLITMTFSKSVPNVGQVQGVARVNVTATRMHLAAAAAPTIAGAQRRLRLVGE
jgi:hypothetical protein